MNEPIAKLLARAASIQRDGRSVIACLLVKARGSTPQASGALMLVDDDASIHGTIGGGCVEAEIRRQAHAMLSAGTSGVLQFKLDHDYGWDDGLICGGTIEMAIAPLPGPDALDRIVQDIHARRAAELEVVVQSNEASERYVLELPPRERLYIAGAGHIGQALARIAVRLEFDVTLFDDRVDMLEKYAPPGCKTVGGDLATALRAAPVDSRTSIAIITRGHRHDEQALHAAVNREAGYVGMIGSRRKVKLVLDDLVELGVPPDSLRNVHAPIGLDIGAVSVEEIAVSIAAELIQHRRAGRCSVVRGPEPRAQSNVRAAGAPISA